MRLLNLLEGISWECLQGKRSMEEKHSMEEEHSMDKEVSAGSMIPGRSWKAAFSSA